MQGNGQGRGRGMGGGAGLGFGHGSGSGHGGGRNRGGAFGEGGYCICAKCGHKVVHVRGVKCTTVKCEKCGTPMVREELLQEKRAAKAERTGDSPDNTLTDKNETENE